MGTRPTCDAGIRENTEIAWLNMCSGMEGHGARLKADLAHS